MVSITSKLRYFLPSIYILLILVSLILRKTPLNKCETSGFFIVCIGLIDVIMFLLAYPAILLYGILFNFKPLSEGFMNINQSVFRLFGVSDNDSFFPIMYLYGTLLLFFIGYLLDKRRKKTS